MRSPAIGIALLLQGCVFVPQTTIVYDEKCRIHTRHMSLRGEQVAVLGHCGGDACLVALATIGIVAGASVIVSGSIVVVGNVVYWIEKQGQCLI